MRDQLNDYLPKTPLDLAIEKVERKWGSVCNPNADLTEVHRLARSVTHKDKVTSFKNTKYYARTHHVRNSPPAHNHKWKHCRDLQLWWHGGVLYTNWLPLAETIQAANGGMTIRKACRIYRVSYNTIFKLHLHHFYWTYRRKSLYFKGGSMNQLIRQTRHFIGAPSSPNDINTHHFYGEVKEFDYYDQVHYQGGRLNDDSDITIYCES